MDGEPRSYSLPTETLHSLDLSHHLDDLVEVRDYFESIGIKTQNSRIERYIHYLNQITTQAAVDPSNVFKNSVSGPFESPIDWLLYVLREVHEMMWIQKGLQIHLPLGVDEKLKEVVSGGDFATLDTDPHSRNTQFELRIASYFCQGGCEVDMSTETDVIASTDNYMFFLECKRVGSKGQLGKRLSKARHQLNSRMPRKSRKRITVGCIAVDVTKVAFPHNGLTWGTTNEHSRDIIQEKLLEVVNVADRMLTFEGCKNLFGYWLQIHIPSLILKPATPTTRLSSYHVVNDGMRRKQSKAARCFYRIFESVSMPDVRAEPPKTLIPRSRIAFPAGTTFWLEDARVLELLDQGNTTQGEQEEMIGALSFSGKDHEFVFFEVCMLPREFIRDWRRSLSNDPVSARLELLARLYAQRFPYEAQDEPLSVPPNSQHD